MPTFSSPFTNVDFHEPLDEREIVRAIRFAVASELEATSIYEQIAASCTVNLDHAKSVLLSIAREEQVHVGELMSLIAYLSPDEIVAYEEGEKEAGGKP